MIVMSSAATGLGILFIAVLIYFAPSLIASRRQVPNAGSVLVINLFLGWTLIGWVVALAMAARDAPPVDRKAQREQRQLENQRLLEELSQRPRKS